VSANGKGPRAQGVIVARLLLGVVALLSGLLSYMAPAHALPAPQASSCAGVWVVVDYGALGGTTTACAGSYSTGMAALRSAFTVVLDAGMVVKINGLPGTPNTQVNYWSYWHATRQADGSYGSWSYSSVGPSSYYPTSTDAEGWRYEPVGGGYIAPGATPPKQTATTQAPPTTAPATTARATTVTRAATTAVASQTRQAPPAATTGPASPSAIASVSESQTPSDTASPVVSGVYGSSVPSIAPTSTSTSSLFGGVTVIAAIAVAAAGMLLWRKRVAARS
jgi:hypothetical protein